jgi:hypothetical protein
MIRAKSVRTFPIDTDTELKNMARHMPHASEMKGAVYHLGRYGAKGLYQGTDPADNSFDQYTPFKDQFDALKNVQNALIVTSCIKKERET